MEENEDASNVPNESKEARFKRLAEQRVTVDDGDPCACLKRRNPEMGGGHATAQHDHMFIAPKTRGLVRVAHTRVILPTLRDRRPSQTRQPQG